MRTRRVSIKSGLLTLVAIGLVVVGLSSSVLIDSVCACGTVNQGVVMKLNWLDRLVQGYAAEHDGLFPTYDEFVQMDEIGERTRKSLTPQVDLASRNFTFALARDDSREIGYAVSDDGRDYVLLGRGLTRKYQVWRLFGIKIWQKFIGYELPILYPGDTPPENSPIS